MPTLEKLRPRQQLRDQVNAANSFARKFFNQPLVPPSFNSEHGVDELVDTSPSELQARFGRRMNIYIDINRHRHTGIDLGLESAAEHATTLQVLNNLDTYVENYYRYPKSRVLHPLQLRSIARLRDFLEAGYTDGYFKLPTRFGKMVIAVEFMEATGINTLFVVPTLGILNQTDDYFADFAPDMEVGYVHSKKKDYSKSVTVITYDSLVRQLRSGRLNPANYQALLLDEGHHSLGPKTLKAVEQFEHAFRLAFTATPGYAEDHHLKNLLTHEIDNVSIREAVEAGLLANYRVWHAYVDKDISQVTINSMGDYNRKQLDRVINIASINQAAIDLYLQEFSGEIAIFNCNSVEHAQIVNAMLKARGVKSEATWGKLDPEVRRRILADLNSGAITAVTQMNLLNEGITIPKASVTLNLRPTPSVVLAEQRGGRTLGIDKDNPDKLSTVIEFIYRDERLGGRTVSFADVSGGAYVARERQPRSNSFPALGSRQPAPRIEIAGLHVVTDTEEIMRVVSDNKIVREGRLFIPEGFVQAPVLELAKEFHIVDATIRNYLRRLKEQYPEQIGGGGGRRIYYITQDGIEILRAELGKSRVSVGFSHVDIEKLAEEFHFSPPPVLNRVRALLKEDPQNFRKAEGGRRRYFATEEGLRKLRDELSESRAPHGFIELDTRSIEQELRISLTVLYGTINELKKQFPNHFSQGGQKGVRMGHHFVTPDGLRILKDTIADKIKVPEGFNQIPVTEMARLRGISPATIQSYLKQFSEEHPDYIKKAGRDNSYHATPEGFELLNNKLGNYWIPERFSMVHLGALAIEFNSTYARVRHEFDLARETHPEYFGGGSKGNPSVATEDGIRILRERLESVQRFILVNSPALALEVGVQRGAVSNNLRRLSEQHPKEFRRDGKRDYAATQKGMTLLREALERLKPPNDMILIDSAALAIVYKISRKSILEKLRAIMIKHPDHFKYSAQQVYYATDQGEKLLNDNLSTLKIPEGYSIVPTWELAEELGTSLNPVYKAIKVLKNKYPSHFGGGGRKRGPRGGHYATPEGMELLRNHLFKRDS